MELEVPVRKLKRNKYGGHKHFRAGNLKGWLLGAYTDRDTAPLQKSLRGKLLALTKHMWDHRTLPTDLSWTILVFLLKVNVDTRWISLIKVLWKAVNAVIDTWVNMVVKFHDVLHVFCNLRGTGMVTM